MVCFRTCILSLCVNFDYIKLAFFFSGTQIVSPEGIDLPETEFESKWDLDSEATVTPRPSQIPIMTCFQDIFESFGLKFSELLRLGVQTLLCQQQLSRK